MHSRFDPQQGVYRSASETVTWPHGETLLWTPAVNLTLPPSPNPLYAYRARVIAWSYVESVGRSALEPDALGREGCRAGAQPSEADLAGYDTGGLAGCVYQYLDHNPSASDMRNQAYTFWSVRRPRYMAERVYTYQIPRLHAVDLVVEVKLLVEVVRASDPTGPALNQATQIERGTYRINLVTPRSTR